MRGIRSGPFVILLLALFGCSDDGVSPSGDPVGPDVIEVTGGVTFFYDNVAADGGVTIDVELDDGTIERLLFAPLYWGDDSEERWRLYEKIRDVEIGNRVTAVGQRTDRGIELEDLTIL